MRHARTAILALALAVSAGCAGGSQAGATGAEKAAPRHDRTIVTGDELSATNAANAYEALQQLRPEFLRSRGITSIRDPQPDLPVVYVNGVYHGGVDVLQSLRPLEIQEIRFVNAADATTRYGTGHPGGVLEVTIRGAKRN